MKNLLISVIIALIVAFVGLNVNNMKNCALESIIDDDLPDQHEK